MRLAEYRGAAIATVNDVVSVSALLSSWNLPHQGFLAYAPPALQSKSSLSPFLPSELIEHKAVYYQEAICNHVAIFPGVKSLVTDLAQNLPLAVASGALRNEVDTILTTAGLINYFKAIVSAEDVERGKPEPDIFLKALAALNAQNNDGKPIDPADCVVIEDSKEGIRGARRAGMKCLAVTNSHPAELLTDANAVVKTLETVTLNFVERLCQ